MRAGRIAATAVVALVAGCGPDYSPNTYAATAVQQANKAETGIIIGVRQIAVSAQGVVGAATGAAAGGVLGSTAPGGAVTSTFGALGGGLVGGLIGTSVEHATGDTLAYEYIVRKANAELVTVTQKDTSPLAVGRHVLVIYGSQARIVEDYTVNPDAVAPAPAPTVSPTTTVPAPIPVTATPLPQPAAPADSPPLAASPEPRPPAP